MNETVSANATSPAAEDLRALSWVQDEVRRSLEAAHKALQRQLKEADSLRGSDVDHVDPAVLRGARTHLHQAAGALELVGMPVPALFVRASEQAVQRLAERPSSLNAKAVETIERASFALMDYLSRTTAGKQVSGVALFPQFRSLLELAGADRVHPADLWDHDWRWRVIGRESGVTAQSVDSQSREVMERLILRLMRTPDRTTLRRMSELCAALGADAKGRRATMWRLAAGFFEAQAAGLMRFDVYVKRAAPRLLAQARLGLRSGDVSDRLAHDLLFFCARANPGGLADASLPRLSAVLQAYGLESTVLPDYEAPALGRFDPAWIALARKRVANARDAWSAVAGGEAHRQHSLGESFALMQESLEKLYPNGAELGQALQHAAQSVGLSGVTPGLAMEVATAVLYLEASLENADLDEPRLPDRVRRLAQRIEAARRGGEPQPLDGWMEELYRHVSDNQTMGSVVQELRSSLLEIEKHIDQYFRHPLQRDLLFPVPGQLSAMRGVLSVLGLEPATQTILRMREDVDQLTRGGAGEESGARDQACFERLADNLGALSFMIDILAVQPLLAKALFRFDGDSGRLRALMGQAHRDNAFAESIPDTGPGDLGERALKIGRDAVRSDVSDEILARELRSLSQQAMLAEERRLADTLSAAQAALERTPEGEARRVMRAELAAHMQQLAKVPEAARGAAMLTVAGSAGAAVLAAPAAQSVPPNPQPLPAQAQPEVTTHLAASAEVGAEPVVETLPATHPALAPEPAAAPVEVASVSADLGKAEVAAAEPAAPVAEVPAPATPAAPGVRALPALSADDAEMLEVFIEEAGEVVTQAREALARLDDAERDSGNDLPEITAIRRAFHTLKGSSRMVGLADFGEAAWACEQLYNARLAQSASMEPALRTLTLQALDYLQDWSAAIAAREDRGHVKQGVMAAADALRLQGRSEPVRLPAAAEVLSPADAAHDAQVAAGSVAVALVEVGSAPVAAGGTEARQDPVDTDTTPTVVLLPPLEVAAGAVDLELPLDAAEPVGQPEPMTRVEPETLVSARAAEPIEVPTGHAATQPEDQPAAGPVPSWGMPVEPVFEPIIEPLVEPLQETVPQQPLWAAAPAKPDAETEAQAEAEREPAAPWGALLDIDLDLARSGAPAPLDALPAHAAEIVAALPPEEPVKVVGDLRIDITMFNIFLNEADELSRRLSMRLAEWAVQPDEVPGENAVVMAHSLAGSSATVGFTELSTLARSLEHALMRSNDAAAVHEIEPVLYTEAADDIRRMLHQFAAGFLVSPKPGLMERLDQHQPAPGEPRVADSELQALHDDVAAEPEALVSPQPAELPAPPAEGLAAAGSQAPIPEASAAAPSQTAPARAPATTPAPAARLLMHDDDDIDALDAVDADLFPIFSEEAAELLPQLQARMREWAARPADRSAAAACMRTLHTFKGGARLAGAMRLGEMAHRLESAIEHLLARAAIDEADIEPLVWRVDGIESDFYQLRESVAQAQQLTDAAAQGEALAAVAAASAAAAFTALASPAQATTAEQPATGADEGSAQTFQGIDWAAFEGLEAPALTKEPQRAAGPTLGAVRVRATLLDRLVNHAGEVSIARTRLETDLGQIKSGLADLSENLERLRRQLRDVEVQAESQISSRLEAAKAASVEFDPLEMDRYTRVQELTRMMAESVNDVATVQRGLQRALQSGEDQLAQQARLTRSLQDDLLRTRMVEFESLSDRLYRVVRQAAKETGKQVRLDIVGGSIEIDRGVLDRMTAPFEHLLRNSITHGIEAPQQREAAGKDSHGLIEIKLAPEGNEVAIEFSDDGAGLDLPRIRERALAQGLIAAGSQPSDAELAELIFAPGFSTAQTVTELAGRGVGMDVVRSEVLAMGGRVQTTSSAGVGARFRMVLPLTTAVTQVVMLRCGSLKVAVPSNLVEIVRREPAGLLENAYRQGTWPHAGENLPFHWLGALLDGDAVGAATGRTVPVIIVRSAAQRVALHVDEVLGNQEVVVKNLGPQLARLPGLAGMTLLPSGTVAAIYNPVALVAWYGAQARRQVQALLSQRPLHGSVAEPKPVVALAPLVLVVDDSLTVRRVTQRLLTREGYRVSTAKDGLDGLERIAEERPRVVLSDIEMPRMDGFDFVRNLRADPALAGLPVIMITSRIAQKHRDYARELGVDHYLGKPYGEEELLGLVARLARREALAV